MKSLPKFVHEQLKEVQKYKVHIIEDRCKGCGFCIEFCPKGVLDRSEKFNVHGYHPPYVKNPDACVGCKFCELVCPDFVIYVEELSKEES